MLRSLLFSLLIFSFLGIKAQIRPLSINSKIVNDKFEDLKPLFPKDTSLCVPQYSTGCGMGDGFTDFAVEEIQNYGSGCSDNTGYAGWSQYLSLGPAFLIPGQSHDFIMKTAYDDQYVTIWVDFNNDFILTQDEKILIDFILANAGEFYTASVILSSNAVPGLHLMRARTNWTSAASDPCQNYTYGEAEDYYVIIGQAIFGTLEGTVTEFTGGAPVAGAEISLDGLFNYTIISGSDGFYSNDNIMVGDYTVTCNKDGYNLQTSSVTIVEDVILTLDFDLTHPEIVVNPLSINVELATNTTTSEQIIIENTGDGELNWSASLILTGKNSKDYFDLQFEYPVAGGLGEAGVESDGLFIYTTKWNGSEIYKYSIDGGFVESFSIPGVAGLRDLAFDGTYFYGGAGIPLVYEMDFNSKILVSSFSMPASVRAIAYNDDGDYFYANNWSDPITLFDKTGTSLGTIATGPEGENYYGFAYDNASPGGPFLWGYAQTGNSSNEIIQIQLPSGTETGFTIDIADKLNGSVYNSAGGLFSHPNLVFGKWTLGGVVQNQWIWGLDLGDAVTWLSASPNAGILAAGESELINVNFDATDLLAGIYNAEILFTSYPLVGSPAVNIQMTVFDSDHPCNLTSVENCTNTELTWEMCPQDVIADSFCIYRNDEVVAFPTDTSYIDELLIPDSTYLYKVTAFIDGSESFHSNIETVFIELPDNLIPENFGYNVSGGNIELHWNTPSGCLVPLGYNIYRDDSFLGFTPNTVYVDPFGFYEYVVTAVYYFGESDPTEPLMITGIFDESTPKISIFPVPASEVLFVISPDKVISYTISSIEGKQLVNKMAGESKFEINTNDFGAGVYLLGLTFDDRIQYLKFTINK